MNRRRFLTLAGANAAGLALVGCGGGGEESARIEVTRIADVEGAPPTLAPNATPPSTQGEQGQQQGDQGGQAAAGGQTHRVEMNAELKFDPAELTLNVGDTVIWVTVGPVPHTSTCDPSKAANPEEHVALPEGAQPWDSGLVNEGEEFSHTFEVPGDYTYFCIPHEAVDMVGHLTVQGQAAAGGQASPQASPEGSPQASPVAEGQAGAAGQGQTHVVGMTDQLTFDPERITVKVGDSITWRTVGAVPHTSTADPSKATNPENVQLPEGAQPWDSGLLNQGQEFTYTFDVPGEYTYFCIPHEVAGMIGYVTVQ